MIVEILSVTDQAIQVLDIYGGPHALYRVDDKRKGGG